MNQDLNKYKGVIIPMVSPFNEDFTIDKQAVQKIIDSFVECEVLPFVLGTTGEVASISTAGKLELVNESVRAVKGRVPLLAGLANNSLDRSIDEGKRFADLGVDALVALLPNYYPLEEKHMLKWFTKLADKLTLPLFLYNIPGTTHHSISFEVIEELSHHPNIVGIKDSEHNKERLAVSLERFTGREDFLFLIGWAAMSQYGLQQGADGIVPSVANLIPGLYKSLYDAAIENDTDEALRLQELTNTISAYNQGGRTLSGAIPALKSLMSLKGLCGTTVLPPLMQMEKEELNEYLHKMEDKILNLA